MDATKITEALSRLDPENSEHWTAQGLPNLEVVNAIMLEDDPLHERIMRKDVEFVAPDFNRVTAVTVEQPDDDKDGTAADETEQSGANEETSDAADDAEREAASSDESEESQEDVDGDTEPQEDGDGENAPQEDGDGENETPSDENAPQEDGDGENETSSDEEEAGETPAETVETIVALDDAEKEDLREELTTELSNLETQRGKAVAAKGDAVKAIDVLDGKIAKVQEQFDGEVGPIPLATALRDFINSSHRERMRRVGRIIQIDKLAGTKTNLSAKAPIDQAMVRNRRRGAKRPPVRQLLPRS